MTSALAQFVPQSWACVLILKETSGIFAVGGRLCSVQLVVILLQGVQIQVKFQAAGLNTQSVRTAVDPHLGIWFQRLGLLCWASCKQTCTAQQRLHFSVSLYLSSSGLLGRIPNRIFSPSSRLHACATALGHLWLELQLCRKRCSMQTSTLPQE